MSIGVGRAGQPANEGAGEVAKSPAPHPASGARKGHFQELVDRHARDQESAGEDDGHRTGGSRGAPTKEPAEHDTAGDSKKDAGSTGGAPPPPPAWEALTAQVVAIPCGIGAALLEGTTGRDGAPALSGGAEPDVGQAGGSSLGLGASASPTASPAMALADGAPQAPKGPTAPDGDAPIAAIVSPEEVAPSMTAPSPKGANPAAVERPHVEHKAAATPGTQNAIEPPGHGPSPERTKPVPPPAAPATAAPAVEPAPTMGGDRPGRGMSGVERTELGQPAPNAPVVVVDATSNASGSFASGRDQDSSGDRSSRGERGGAPSSPDTSANPLFTVHSATAKPMTGANPPPPPAPADAAVRDGDASAAMSAAHRMVLNRPAHGQIDLAELGRVEVRAKVRDGDVDVRVTAERAETATLLLPRVGEMTADVRAANISVGRFDVETGANGSSSQRDRQPERDPAGTPTSEPVSAPSASARRVRILL